MASVKEVEDLKDVRVGDIAVIIKSSIHGVRKYRVEGEVTGHDAGNLYVDAYLLRDGASAYAVPEPSVRFVSATREDSYLPTQDEATLTTSGVMGSRA